MRIRTLLPASCALALALPSTASAAEFASGAVPEPLSIGVGIIGLLLAVVLLIDVLALRRVAEGAAIAENIAYVMAGVLCLATAVLLGWLARFVDAGLSTDQVRLGADMLVIASMVLLGIYFHRVRGAMVRFLRKAAEYEDILVQAHVGEGEDVA